ncbi:MAG: hypothetical protein MUO53_04000 [Maribacter sp.]|nr:hypothetical protein [Maribacter sp.]
MEINTLLTAQNLSEKISRLWSLSGDKIKRLALQLDGVPGSPVVTVNDTYGPRSWTDWTFWYLIRICNRY